MNNIDYVPKFVDKLEEFVDKLEDLFPEEQDIGNLSTGIKWCKSFNKGKLVNDFSKYVYPYREHIFNKDIDFFLKFEYTDVIEDLNAKENGEGSMKVSHFKTLFNKGGITKETIESIFRYLQILCAFIKKINEN